MRILSQENIVNKIDKYLDGYIGKYQMNYMINCMKDFYINLILERIY